jgi:hypothetical protein
MKSELKWSNYSTKTNGRVEFYPQAMSTVSADQDNWLASRAGWLGPEGTDSSRPTLRVKNLMSIRPYLDAVKKEIIYARARKRNGIVGRPARCLNITLTELPQAFLWRIEDTKYHKHN